MSICPSVCMYQHSYHTVVVCEIWQQGRIWNSVKKSGTLNEDLCNFNFSSNIKSPSMCSLQVEWYQAVMIAEGI
jgi:hypothetical protein